MTALQVDVEVQEWLESPASTVVKVNIAALVPDGESPAFPALSGKKAGKAGDFVVANLTPIWKISIIKGVFLSRILYLTTI